MPDFVAANISKSFGAVKALDGVTFEANLGEVHAILGENGAGKSTLIKIFSGVQRADNGTVTLLGEKLEFRTPKEAIKNGVGTIFQELSLMHDLTVAQNIFFEHWPKSKGPTIRRRQLREKTMELLREYDINDIDPDKRIDELSLSQQQIVEIIKVISRNPRIVIMDEATSALSQNRVQWLLSLAQRLAREGKLVIFISHRLQEIKQSCNRVTVFRNGKDVGMREMCKVDNDELVAMMIGRKLSAYFPEWHRVATDEVLLETKSLSISKLLHDVSFQLYRGEVLGVGGLAGQGQIPLFLSLAGVATVRGEIILEGRRIVMHGPSDGIKHGIALIPEDRSTEGLVQTMSIRDNMSMSSLRTISRWGFIDKKKEDRVVTEAIEKLSIKMGSANDPMISLSGGNQQKVLISKFLMIAPKVILMLDPTRGVDVGTKVEIFKLVRKIAEDGNAVLYYSTDMSELIGICDRVMIMCDNTISGILAEPELTNENLLKLSVGERILSESGTETCKNE